jgi:phosphoenolpyruvate synthase/pyruvate phosphate dikinase
MYHHAFIKWRDVLQWISLLISNLGIIFMVTTDHSLSKAFTDLTSHDVAGYGQKGVNCALILQDNDAISLQAKNQSDIPIIAVPGFVFPGSVYRDLVNTNKLNEPICEVLDQFNNGLINQYECSAKIYTLFESCSLSDAVKKEIVDIRYSLARQVAKILNIAVDEVLGSMSLYFRSNADIGEDGQISDGLSLDQIREMIGAGKHESYGQNYTIPECNSSALKVCASTYSPQACGQYKGQRGIKLKWLQMEVNQCLLVLVEVHSIDLGSALGFGEITGDFIDLNLGKKLAGDDLVGGKKEGIKISYHIPTNALIDYSHPVSFLSENTIKAIAERVSLIGNRNNLIPDTEWSFGGLIRNSSKHFCVPVQFRDFTPVQAEKRVTTIQDFEITQNPPIENLVSEGLASSKRCVVGEVVTATDDNVPNTDGKILVAREANPSYSGFIPNTLGFVFGEGATNCHMGLMTRGRRAAVFSASKIKQILEGTEITILGNKVYKGNWSSSFKVNELDLLQCKIPIGTKAKFVDDGNIAFLGDLYPYLALGLSEGYDLLRMEASNVAHGIPSPLSFIHYDQLDLDTPLGVNIKAFIDNAMLAFGTTDPQQAYRKLSVSKLARPMALCKRFGKKCSVRKYGGRIKEHDHGLKHGTLPDEANPIISFNGLTMYFEDWGKDVLKLSVQILDDLRQMGYDNTELFIPNVATIEGLKMVLDMMLEWGINPANWTLKPMMETQEFCSTKNMLALKKLAAEYGIKEVVISFGFNDFALGTCNFDNRMYVAKDGRGNIDSERYTDQVSELILFCNSIGISVSSCGLPKPAMMKVMQNIGAVSVGLPPGIDFYNGLITLNS